MTLKVFTLGRFDVLRGGAPLPSSAWGGQKARDLGKILLTFHGQPVDKASVQAWLWPDLPPHQTHRHLDLITRRLQAVLGETLAPLIDDGATLRLDCRRVWLDTDVVETAAQVDIEAPTAIATLEAADDLYQGPYLPNDWEAEWAATTRARLALAYETLLLKLSDAYGLRGQYQAASLACRSLLLANPTSLQGIMRLLHYTALAEAHRQPHARSGPVHGRRHPQRPHID